MGSAVTVIAGQEAPACPPSGSQADTAEVEAALRLLTGAVPARLLTKGHMPPLIRAAAADDLETARRLVACEDGLNAPGGDRDGKRPLHMAVVVEGESILQRLLALDRSCGRAGGPRLLLDAPDANSLTALHYAAMTRNSFATHLLLEAGASVDCRDLEGQTPLMKAVKWDDVAQPVALLGAGADADAADAVGRTALHLAAAAGSCATVRLLLGRGARRDAADESGQTPLACALRHQRRDAAALLLPAAAYLPRADRSGRTELHWAAAHGTPDMVERLLRFGPSRWPHDKAGMTPLLRALEARNAATAELLLEAPSRHKMAADAEGRTALHWAARAGLAPLVCRLLQAGCPAWAPDKRGRDALMWALQGADQEAAMAVLAHAGFRQRADRFGCTALHFAASRGNATVALNLLQHGADADAADFIGWTPLAYALHHGADSVADVLRCYSAEEAPFHFPQ